VRREHAGADADAVAGSVADAAAAADSAAVADAVADADAVAGARAGASAHDAKERCTDVVEGVEELVVDLVDVAECQRNVEASACLAG
jgi:hypothetical protein